MTYSIQHIRNLRRIVVARNLPRPEWFDGLSDDYLQSVYNGIGSDKYKSLLWLTTEIFETFEPAALIHDSAWAPANNDGSVERWRQSNSDFRAGCHILAATCGVWFGLFRPQQRRLFHANADLLAAVVSSHSIGWPCWLSGANPETGPERMETS